MAKGADSEEFVLLSGPKTDLKREFGFPVKGQSEVSGSNGRIRGRNLEGSHSNQKDMEEPSSKRFKGSLEEEEGIIANVEEVPGNEEPVRDSIVATCKGGSMNNPKELVNGEVPQNNVSSNIGEGDPKSECLNSLRKEGLESCIEGNGSKSTTVSGDNVESRDNVSKKFSRRFTRSALKHKEEPLVIDDCNEGNNALSEKRVRRFTRSSLETKADQNVLRDNGKVEDDSPEESLCCSTHLDSESKGERVVMDDNGEDASLDKSPSCAAPLGSEANAEQMLMDDNAEVQNASEGKTSGLFTGADLEPKAEPRVLDDSTETQSAPKEKAEGGFTRSALEPMVDHMVMDDRIDGKEVSSQETPGQLSMPEAKVDQNTTDDIREANNASPEKTVERFTASTLEAKVEATVIPDTLENALSDKIKRRFTRSALELKAEPLVMNDNNDPQSASSEDLKGKSTPTVLKTKANLLEVDVSGGLQSLPDEPVRRLRFTRSALNPKEEQIESSATAGGSSSHSEETCNGGSLTSDKGRNGTVCPSAAKKNLEMKMSKKISLTKLPSTVKELLETSMLEGFPVKYISNGKKSVELRGTIKGHGIMCSCTYCNGNKVVTPGVFELHAGSTNKHPADNIYLENGNSLRDVLNACKDAALETLETTIQSAICSSSVNDSIICTSCKGGLPLNIRSAVPLCSSCLEASKTQSITAHTDVTETRLTKPVMTPKSLNDVLQSIRSQSKSTRGKITRKDLRLHKLVFEENGLPDGTELAYYHKGEKLLEGYKKGSLIFCRCCNSEVSPSTFEAHAGCASRRKPYDHIYTSNGVSLHELSLSLSKVRKFSPNDNDDLCRICGDCGDLLLCDGCPRAFHKDCVGQSSVPQGNWYCPYCQNMFRKEQSCAKHENALAAGRVSGVDPIEQITKRCIRIVETVEPEVGGCALCRCHGFSKIGFGPRTVIICDQCEKEFHVGCLKDNKMDDLKELPKGDWFCCMECNRIHTVLQKLILRGSEELPSSISCVIKNKLDEKCLNNGTNVDARWRLLNGKVANPESRQLLSRAVTIFHDRFDPIHDSLTGRDLIPAMVYGKKGGGQEYQGMYCAVLTVNSLVVSAGILRIFGQEIAELPLVATSSDYQGQGYFQSLFCCIERLLGFLNVKNLVLPAAEEAEAIWVNKFGFEKMNNDQLSEYKRYCQMTTFQGTSMLQKPVPKCRVVNRSKRDS